MALKHLLPTSCPPHRHPTSLHVVPCHMGHLQFPGDSAVRAQTPPILKGNRKSHHPDHCGAEGGHRARCRLARGLGLGYIAPGHVESRYLECSPASRVVAQAEEEQTPEESRPRSPWNACARSSRSAQGRLKAGGAASFRPVDFDGSVVNFAWIRGAKIASERCVCAKLLAGYGRIGISLPCRLSP